jgi:hypothetical protein
VRGIGLKWVYVADKVSKDGDTRPNPTGHVTISKGSKGSNQGTNRSVAYLRHSVALITCENRGSDCLTC